MFHEKAFGSTMVVRTMQGSCLVPLEAARAPPFPRPNKGREIFRTAKPVLSPLRVTLKHTNDCRTMEDVVEVAQDVLA
jgi:hypothetical protein